MKKISLKNFVLIVIVVTVELNFSNQSDAQTIKPGLKVLTGKAGIPSVSAGNVKNHKSDQFIENNQTEENETEAPGGAIQFEMERTLDPSTGKVPKERLLYARNQTLLNRQNNFLNKGGPIPSLAALPPLSWTERGPFADAVGPTNFNTRSNNGITSGRIRAICVDRADSSGKTVWAGGVDGGIWKTNDITAAPANWILINDFLINLSVSDICQDPSNFNTFYFCTGEAYFNFDAVKGEGVFKSTDHGLTWNQLGSTVGYKYCSRILCDQTGNIYLGTKDQGLLRSTDSGTSWTTITPSTSSSVRITDLEISSTGRLHVTIGLFEPTSYYFFSDTPATTTSSVSSGNWQTATTVFPLNNINRTEIACSGNFLYALPADLGNNVPVIYKSIDGGANWISTGSTPAFTNGQGWYCLAVAIDPSNSDHVIVGSLDCFKSIDAGATWTQSSAWVGLLHDYVHADQHLIKWYDGGRKLLIGCDGGIHFSSDSAITIRDRNEGLRLKQFYSVAIHPDSVNYFLCGAQDNGVHQLTQAGLGTSVEVFGGDGGFVAIDQDQPQYQFGSYIYNQYRRSTNGGVSWSSVNFSGSSGQFINPWDYDDSTNIMYCGYSQGSYLRWNNPQSGADSSIVQIAALNAKEVTAVTVSAYTANRVYFGTKTGNVIYVDAANTAPSGTTGTHINTGLPSNVYTSCIAEGTDDQNLMVCYSNYGVQNIWVSSNGGILWTNIDGNLPDMPVRWCMFFPDDNTKAYIATETGVWETGFINDSSTVWVSNSTFPVVRTDMIKYRQDDRTLAAATHGRGLWTASVPLLCIPPEVNFPGLIQPTCETPAGGIQVSAISASLLEYSIDSGYTWQSSVLFNGLPSGNYYIVARTAALPDCLTFFSGNPVILNSVSYPVPVINNNLPFCSNSQIVLDAEGGWSGYNWSDGTTTQFNVVQSANTYTVTVTNGAGCTGSTSVTTVVNPSPMPIISGSTSFCSGSSTTLAAGIFNSYLWSNSATTQSVTINYGGPFSVIVTNGFGCTASALVNLNPFPLLAINGSSTNLSCKGIHTGSITISPSLGVAPYTYLWNNGLTIQNRTSLGTGTYSVTVTDANNCTKNALFYISQPSSSLLINTGKTNVRCAGSATGKASVAPSGGTPPYIYSWNTVPSQTSASVSGLYAGVYHCTITDGNNCTKSAVVTITEPPLILVLQYQSNSTFPGANNGTASVSVSGGTPPYTYIWNTVPASTNTSVSGLAPGTYKCKVYDSKSCTVKATFMITEPAPKAFPPDITGNIFTSLFIFPNPAHDMVTLFINVNENSGVKIMLMDISGRLMRSEVHSARSGINDYVFNLKGMAKGIYFLEIQAADKTLVKKVLVE